MFAVFRWLGQKTNFLYYLFCTLRSGGLDILRKLNSDVAKENPTVGYSGALVSFNCRFDTAYSHLIKRTSIKGLTRSGWPVGMLLWEGPALCGWDYSRGLSMRKPSVSLWSSLPLTLVPPWFLLQVLSITSCELDV